MTTASLLPSAVIAALALTAPVFAQTSDVPQPPAGVFAEPWPLTRGVDLLERRVSAGSNPGDGFFVDFSNMITGSGWISAGPGYRRHILDGRALLTTSAALSWRLYKMAQARVEVPGLAHKHASVGLQALYRDSLQVDYFGLGNNTSFADRTGYRLKTGDVSAYGSWKAGVVTAEARAGWLGYADVAKMAGWGIDYPDTTATFNDTTAPGLASQPGFLHADASLVADFRDEVADPSRGGVYRASMTRYDDRGTGRFTFNLYELDAAQYVTIVPEKVVLAGHAWAALTSVADGSEVPFYLMPSLGGRNTLRGFDDFRFYDRNMETFSLEARVRVYAHLDGAVFVDTGEVAPRAGALGLSDLHTSVGVGVRLRSRDVTFGRLDVAKGPEGWHFILMAREPFKRKTFDGRIPAIAPFVP
jgi:hypothetical protein